MCGIAGIVRVDALTAIDRSFLDDAASILSHRGPDGVGTWSTSHAGLAHRRLAIIDLESGSQPMHDATGRFTITFNGEIYNYRALRQLLAEKGRAFQSHSDTEVILNAFAEWGTACVERLDGMFAFAVWDARDRSLFIARDHLGIKPLAYSAGPGFLIFGSELKAILRHPAVERGLDMQAVSDYLSLGYVLSPKTILRHVRTLPAATWLLWRDGDVRQQRYWDLAAIANGGSRRSISFKSAVEELRGELHRAVTGQLVSDVPLGAFLSGGIDSSTIVQQMIGTGSRPRTFCIGFAEASYDERPYASLVARELGADHAEQVVSVDVESALPRLAWHFDDPFADTAAAPTYALSRFARRSVKVALSGDGGDECFAGYETYVADRLGPIYRVIPSPIRALIGLAVNRIPATHQKVSWDYKVRQFVSQASGSPEAAHYGWRLLFTEAEKSELWREEGDRAVSDYRPLSVFLDAFREVARASPLSGAQYVDIKTWLADAMLVKVDRASMACGLEVRVPLLDRRLVEFAMSLPANFKLRGFETKAILKAAMAPFLPPAILRRRKRGFNAPVAQWTDRISDDVDSVAGCDVLPGLRPVWTRLIEEHRQHRADNGFKLWTLLMWQHFTKSSLKPACTTS